MHITNALQDGKYFAIYKCMRNQETIKAINLRLGMHVVLPLSWFKHPFFVNEFIIDSQEQIDKIVEYGISEVIICTGRVTLQCGGRQPPLQRAGIHFSEDMRTGKTWSLLRFAIPSATRRFLRRINRTKTIYEATRDPAGKLLEDHKIEKFAFPSVWVLLLFATTILCRPAFLSKPILATVIAHNAC